MAEARREIVTALKFHRAAMKQASKQQYKQTQEEQKQQTSLLLPQSPHPCFDQEEGWIKSRRIPRVYPLSIANFGNYPENFCYPSFSHPPLAPYPFSWSPVSPFASPSCAENLNCTLPKQPLGLNLNFHDFQNLEVSPSRNRNIPSLYSSLSLPSNSLSNLSIATGQEVPSVPMSKHDVGTPPVADAMGSIVAAGATGGGLHAAMDDEEMEEIRLIGERHQIEWDDTMNLVTSAWWFKFLKMMELDGPEIKVEEDDGNHPFREIMEFSGGWMQMRAIYNNICMITAQRTTSKILPCLAWNLKKSKVWMGSG